jgi:hypothetical protein
MHGCTITTSHYLAHTRVLAESFLARHPGAEFSALVIDDSPGPHDRDEPFHTLAPADIGVDLPELNRRATMYLTQGLAVSMKPNLLLELLSRGDGPILFLDADSYVYDDLEHVAELAQRHSLVLSPHSLDPYPLWKVDGPEQIFIRAGVMNAGFIGIGEGAQTFLQWWAERMARRCIFDPERGLFLEQTWLMLAPALFEHHILRDRGCNVAGWNLHTRDVQWEGDAPTIDGGPLRHYHFACSYDPEHPERLTAQEHAHWWPTLQERPGVARLSREYAERLFAHGHRQATASPPLFDTMPGGASIESWMRASYREALMAAEEDGAEEPPNPFSHGEESFVRWLEPLALERAQGVSAEPSRASTTTSPDPSGAPAGGAQESGDPVSAQELAQAMLETRTLLARIRELGADRDDTVRWAERVTAELEQAEGMIVERDSSIAELEGRREQLAIELEHLRDVIGEIVSSPSWRVTRPLRAAKALAGRVTTRAQ